MRRDTELHCPLGWSACGFQRPESNDRLPHWRLGVVSAVIDPQATLAVVDVARKSRRSAKLRAFPTDDSTYGRMRSARTSSEDGIVKPSSWAAPMFTMSSIFDDCSTGRSDGLAPRRMRPQ